MVMNLRVENLCKRFTRNVLFRELTFDLSGGESLAVVGPNGSGKSTLLQIIAGLQQPTSGSVMYKEDDKVLPKEIRLLQIGFAAPYLNLYTLFSANENLQFIARARQLTNATKRIERVLDRVGLGHVADEEVKTFSSGMLQRLRVAAATLSDPELLVLDEPGTNLDKPGREMVEGLITDYLEMGRGVIVATNAETEADWCQRTVSIPDFNPAIK